MFGGAGGGADRCILGEDALLDQLELRARVKAELVGEVLANALVGSQRIGLPPCAVQRGDQQFPQGLLERVRHDCGFQLPHHGAEVAEAQPRPVVHLEQSQPSLLEAGPMNADPFGVTCPGQDFASKQLQARRRDFGCVLGVTCFAKPNRGRRLPEGHPGVHLSRLNHQRIATVAARDNCWPKSTSKHRHLRLQRVPPGLGGSLSPQVLEQTVGAHQRTGLQRKSHQQLGSPASRHLDMLAVADDLEWPQQRD